MLLQLRELQKAIEPKDYVTYFVWKLYAAEAKERKQKFWLTGKFGRRNTVVGFLPISLCQSKMMQDNKFYLTLFGNIITCCVLDI